MRKTDSIDMQRSGFMRPPLVLAYHALGEVGRAYDPEALVIAPGELRSQISRLQARDYEFVKMTEFARRLIEGEPLAGVCALTFDDGSHVAGSFDVPACGFHTDVCTALSGSACASESCVP